MPIATIDFEASCLPIHGRSYPIEVGIAEDDHAARSWLIRPHESWQDWDWTEEAERLHGLSRAQLIEDGLPVETVAAELAEALRGRRVFADSYLDGEWMATLAAAAQVALPARVGHLEEILVTLGVSGRAVAEMDAALDAQGFARHRAGEDARRLYALIEGLRRSRGHNVRAGAPLFRWANGEDTAVEAVASAW
jgi:hypothetical protein